ncbi:MAG: glycosyl hydrolase family 28-related protein [Bacteroidota bacterium]
MDQFVLIPVRNKSFNYLIALILNFIFCFFQIQISTAKRLANFANEFGERSEFSQDTLGLPTEENNIVFPDGAGVIDVTKAPYFAAGDGVTDDTDAINQAMRDHPDGQFIIYLPNGTYRVSDRIDWPRVSATDTSCTTEQSCRYTILQGQNTDNTVIKLRDNAPGYQDPANRKSMIWCGQGVAQRFRNAVRNLTVNVGSGNPGAVGLQFNANNTGGIFDTKVISEDGQGVHGIDFSYTNEIGPLLVKNVEIDGFNRAITTNFNVNSMTMENITIRNQTEVGIFVLQQVVNIRKLISFNEVTAIQTLNQGSYLTLIDSELNGIGNAVNVPAIFYGTEVFLRNVSTPGYRNAVTFNLNGTTPISAINDLYVDEFNTGLVKLCDNVEQSLNLPISDAPVIPLDDPSKWANIDDFGANKEDNIDDTPAIQAAMNSGASTILVPVSSFRNGSYIMGSNVTVPASVKRIIGTEGRISGSGSLELTGGSEPIIIERFDNIGGVLHTSSRTLVMKSARIRSYICTSGADLYLENVGFPAVTFSNQNVWARQLNIEVDGISILNDNSNLWIFGYKTEKRGTKIRTINGGKTEVLGAHIYSINSPTDEFMFEVENASLSLAGVRETNFANNPYTNLIKEVRGNVTKELKAGPGVTPGGINSSGFPLFVGYIPSNTNNLAPEVSAPDDITIVLPVDSIIFNGEVNDDGLPGNNCFTDIQWTQIEGPASSIIGSPDSVSTSVVLPEAGKYSFVITANDGVLEGSDTVTIFLYNQLITTADHNGDGVPSGSGADVEVRAAGGSGNNYGGQAGIGIRHDPSRFHRKGYLKFDVSALPEEISLAGLSIEISTTNTGQIQDWTYNVFGLEEATDYGTDILDEFWEEGNKNGEAASATELAYINAPGNGSDGGGVYDVLTNSGGGVNNEQTRFLGTFSTRAGIREIINFNSDSLAAFINDDTNGLITLIITRVERNTSNLISFSSKENTKFIAPTLNINGIPQSSASVIGEADKLADFGQNNSDQWQTVSLTENYTNPVVVAGPLSFNGSNPSTIRVRNVDSTSFEIQIDEWDYLDGFHIPEDLSYMVIEAGSYTLSDGTVLQAGIQENVGGQLSNVSYPEPFHQAPIIFSQCISTSGSSAVITRTRDINNENFRVRLQVEEANSVVVPEKVAWIAITPGVYQGERPFEVSIADEQINHIFGQIQFQQTYDSPILLADMQGITGGDPASLRYRNLTSNSVEIKVEEETSDGDEINHNPESIGYLIFEGAGPILGTGYENITLNARRSFDNVFGEIDSVSTTEIYPNPAYDVLNIRHFSKSDQIMNVSLHTLQGGIIMELEDYQLLGENASTTEVDISSLNDGIYILKITLSEEADEVHRIIKLNQGTD